jgi:hypothetical protein
MNCSIPVFNTPKPDPAFDAKCADICEVYQAAAGERKRCGLRSASFLKSAPPSAARCSKPGRVVSLHVVHLSEEALTVLNRMERRGALVFSIFGNKPFSDGARRALSAVILIPRNAVLGCDLRQDHLQQVASTPLASISGR